MLLEIITGHEGGFDEVNGILHGVGNHATGACVLPGGGRLLATHEQYRKQYHKGIYLVRDVRDVILSEFAYTTALEFFDGDLDAFISEFLRKKVNPFGPWQKHAASWLDSPIAGTPNFLKVHYEELRKNPVQGFTRIAQFLGVNSDAARIQSAIEHNSLAKMKEKEKIAPQRASVKGQFVRKGEVQGWRAKLTPQQVQFVAQYAGEVLQRLGYPLSGETAEREPVLQVLSR
ncbi:MAG: sulfotransferase domain-containing protein [Candidatus Acidiferrales bacterium]